MRTEKVEKIKSAFTLALIIAAALIIISGLSLNYEDKADSEVQEHIEENYEETGAINLVEAVLLDLRAYDTFGEVMVIYIAIAGVIILGKKLRREVGSEGGAAKREKKGEESGEYKEGSER
ncbi:MAG: hydrogen gas-evolving membrane-bound hydrogenase subunit E [Candidatus Thermoplasmatota archaeon]